MAKIQRKSLVNITNQAMRRQNTQQVYCDIPVLNQQIAPMHAMFLRVSPKKGDLALSAQKSLATTLQNSLMESASKSSN